jgi:arylsulfatase A-like enzyme
MTLVRREFLLGALAFPALSAQKKAPSASPSILLVIANDMSSWMLGCYGNKEIRTPNIDLLARGGTRFANNFVCTPSSAPSRATLLTGRLTPGTTPSLQNEIMISDLLAEQGYNCGYVGDWEQGVGSTPQHHFQSSPTAVEFLEQQNPGKPFFLTVSYANPYEQGRAPKYEEMYAQSTFESMGREPVAPNAHRGQEMMRDVVSNLRKFAAGLTAIDDQIPPLLSKLHERRLRDNTLILLCGSSGFLLGRHGLWSDGDASDPVNMYEEAIAVPMLWNWPGRVPVESVRNELVSLYDVMPALCEVVGVQSPAGRKLPGRSYAPMAFGRPLPKKQPWRNLVFGQYRNTTMVRDSRYKLVLRNERKGPNELFELSRDARERVNQFNNPAFLSIRDQLAAQLGTWEKSS